MKSTKLFVGVIFLSLNAANNAPTLPALQKLCPNTVNTFNRHLQGQPEQNQQQTLNYLQQLDKILQDQKKAKQEYNQQSQLPQWQWKHLQQLGLHQLSNLPLIGFFGFECLVEVSSNMQ